MRLDRSKPFDEFYGQPGVRYHQAGRFFLPNGKEVGVVDDAPDDEKLDNDLIAKAIADGSVEIDNLNDAHLKAALDEFGEEYTTREAAIRFLKEGLT